MQIEWCARVCVLVCMDALVVWQDPMEEQCLYWMVLLCMNIFERKKKKAWNSLAKQFQTMWEKEQEVGKPLVSLSLVGSSSHGYDFHADI